MSQTTPPRTGLPPLPPAAGRPAGLPPVAGAKRFTVERGVRRKGQRVAIYGTGGAGKSSLAAGAPNPVFLDLEEGTNFMDVARVPGIDRYEDLRDLLLSTDLHAFQTIVIDSMTKAEELIADYIVRTRQDERGKAVESLEGYGFGKGYKFLYEKFVDLLTMLEMHTDAGRNVVLIAHDCIVNVVNPDGTDYPRHEPRLWKAGNGNNDLRQKMKEWADHLLFIGYDIAVGRDGKATSNNTRTIYTQERATCMAKSRTLVTPIPFPKGDGSLWQKLTEANQ